MAIQMRRGSYDDFDPTRMLAGEWAIILSGDPNTASGRAIYHCYVAGQVERVATYKDAVQIIINAIPETVDALTSAVQNAEALRVLAEAARVEAEDARVLAEQAREDAQDANDRAQVANDNAQTANDNAQSANDSAQAANDLAQAANDAQQALNNQMATGAEFHVCTSGEYDQSTLRPTIANPRQGIFYLVPTGASSDPHLEWIYIEDDATWENVGTNAGVLDPITTDDIDDVVDETVTSPQGNSVLNLTGLSYFWANIKAWALGVFALVTHTHTKSQITDFAHTHAASEVTSGTLDVARGGTGVTTAADERDRLGLGATTGALPVANGGTGATDAATARTNLDAAQTTHTHTQSQISDTPISVANGGTGAATHTSNAVLTGNGTSAVNNVATADGALYATAANGAAQFGTLPIAQGGTGATTAAAARTALDAAQANGATNTLYDAEQAISDLESAVGTVDVSTDGDLQSQIDTLQDSVSVVLNQNVSYSSTAISSVQEYIRYSKFGRLVIIDVGGVAFATTNMVSNALTGLPVLRTRPVCSMFDDMSNVRLGIFYGSLGSTSLTCRAYKTGTTAYGQIIYLTD